MMNRIDRRKRNKTSCIALVDLMFVSCFRPAAARTWEVLVEPATYVLLDHNMIRKIPESDPFFTQTQLGTDPPTPMPVPTPSPVPLPTSAPSSVPSLMPTRTPGPTISPAPVIPTISPQPTVYVSYPPGQGPTASPTPFYRNENPDNLCTNGEKLHEIHLQDTFGDGWDGRNLTISVANSSHVLSKVTETQDGNSTVIKYKTTTLNGTDVYYNPGNKIWSGTLYGGSITVDYVCIRPGVCYEASISAGAWAEEIIWELKQPTYNVTTIENYNGLVVAKGGAPVRCLFSIPDPVSGMTYCPTTCNRFPGDPTPNPSLSPTETAFPSGAPSSSVPSSNVPSLVTSLEASMEPSTYHSSNPSENPTERPSAAPTPPQVPPVIISQTLPTLNTPTVLANTPTRRPPINVPTPPVNNDSVKRPMPTLNRQQTTGGTGGRQPTQRTNRYRFNKRRPAPSLPSSTVSPPTAVLPPKTTTTTVSPPTPQASDRVSYNRPYTSGENNQARRPAGGQSVEYRHPVTYNTADTGSAPTPAPEASPTKQKEVLDPSFLGNGVRQ